MLELTPPNVGLVLPCSLAQVSYDFVMFFGIGIENSIVSTKEKIYNNFKNDSKPTPLSFTQWVHIDSMNVHATSVGFRSMPTKKT